jgi:uncharacterized DUF497 family protein
MEYVWDRAKRLSNLKKHGIDFVDAIGVLEDEHALTKSQTDEGEYRYITLGVGVKPGVLLVVHVEEEEEGVVAIISARPADRKEKRQYYEGVMNE